MDKTSAIRRDGVERLRGNGARVPKPCRIVGESREVWIAAPVNLVLAIEQRAGRKFVEDDDYDRRRVLYLSGYGYGYGGKASTDHSAPDIRVRKEQGWHDDSGRTQRRQEHLNDTGALRANRAADR